VTGESVGPGVFGKLPAHGDFVSRGLPHDVVERLHALLLETLAAGRRGYGDAWLGAYLTAPIWHFTATGGCLGRGAMLGLLMPSVDAVGRHFPVVLVHRRTGDAGALGLLTAADGWFAEADALALAALDQDLDADGLSHRLHALSAPAVFAPPAEAGTMGPPWRAALDPDADGGSHAGMLRACGDLGDHALRRALGAYSVWTTQGSDRVAPELCAFAGLPDAASLAGFMAGSATAAPAPVPLAGGSAAP
jgi:type VI secretion system protein ImpM